MKKREDMLAELVGRFGAERLFTALPQDEACKVMHLVSIGELAARLGLKYTTVRSRMNNGKIPFPTIRLVRRAYFTAEEADAIVAAQQGRLGRNLQK